MTTQEIKALIAAKIAGQGSMVDAGGALPAILDAIVDAIDAITPGEVLSFAEPLKKSGTDVSLQIGGGLEKDSDDALAVKLATGGGLKATASGLAVEFIGKIYGYLSQGVDKTRAQMASWMNITPEQLDAIIAGNVGKIVHPDTYQEFIPLNYGTGGSPEQDYYIVFWTTDNTLDALFPAFTLTYYKSTELYSLSEV